MRLSMFRGAVTKQGRRSRRGMTLIEAALSLGVAAFVLVGLAQLLMGAAESTRARATADRLQEVTHAAQDYVKTYYPALLTATASGKVEIPIARTTASEPIPAGTPALPSVQKAGFLSSSYVDRNAYNQSHMLVVRRVDNNENRLEAVISSVGGNDIPDEQLGRIASMIGADGGFMMEDGVGAAGVITGVNGGWSTAAADWTMGSKGPKTGRVMSSLALHEGALVSDYLNRNDIGIPEANRMRTNLQMGLKPDGSNAIASITAENHTGSITFTKDTANTDVTQIGPNVSVPGYITAQKNITSMGGNIEARTVGGTGGYITASVDMSANRNVAAGNNVTAGANVVAGNDVRGKRFVDADNSNYVVDPNATSKMNKLSTDRFDLDTYVYLSSESGSDWETQNVRLRDMFPNYVTKGGYVVRAGYTLVPKPNCPSGEPKITLSMMQDTTAFRLNLPYDTYGTPYGTFVTNLHTDSRTYIGRRLAASNYNANFWNVHITGTNSVANDLMAFALTHCYYGH